MDNALRSSVAICEFYSQLFDDFRIFSTAQFAIKFGNRETDEMHHAIVKLWSGKSESKKNRLAEKKTHAS
jgi:hypothetical protein